MKICWSYLIMKETLTDGKLEQWNNISILNFSLNLLLCRSLVEAKLQHCLLYRSRRRVRRLSSRFQLVQLDSRFQIETEKPFNKVRDHWWCSDVVRKVDPLCSNLLQLDYKLVRRFARRKRLDCYSQLVEIKAEDEHVRGWREMFVEEDLRSYVDQVTSNWFSHINIVQLLRKTEVYVLKSDTGTVCSECGLN